MGKLQPGSKPITQPTKIKFAIVLAVCLLLLAIIGAFYLIKGNRPIIQPYSNAQPTNPSTDVRVPDNSILPQGQKTFQVIKDFPFYGGSGNVYGNVYFDPGDNNKIWLSFSGAIVSYDLQNDTWQPILTGIKGLDNSPYLLVKKGNSIFFSLYNEGFERIDLQTGQRKIYTVKEGLINSGNVKIYSDPNSIDLWIATFNGVSRFDTKTEKFTNYTTELGGGTHWGINDMVVNKDFVWVVIRANSDNVGGIARYDINTGGWKVWGPGAFNGHSSVNIMYNMDAINGKAIASARTTDTTAGDRVVEYDSQTDQWQELFKNSGYKNFTYLGDRVYFTNGTKVFYYDRSRNRIFPTTLESQSSSMTIYRDPGAHRLIMMDWPKQIVIYNLDNNQTKQLKFEHPEQFLSRLITANNDMIVFSNDKDIIVHDLSTNTDRIISAPEPLAGAMEGKIVGDYLLIVYPDPGGESCIPEKLYLINLNKYTTKQIANSDCWGDVFVGNSLLEIFVGTRSYGGHKITSLRKYDPTKNILVDQPISAVNLQRLDPILISGYGYTQAFSSDGSVTAESMTTNAGSVQIKVKISHNGITEIESFPIPSEQLNAFNRHIDQSIYSLAFDKTTPNYLWIGTNLGLLVYDLQTQNHRLLTTADGLVSNKIKKIISLSDNLVISDDTGAYIFQMNREKLLP